MSNSKIDLQIPEDRLEEFEAWFATHCASGKVEVASFSSDPGSNLVTYKVAVTVRSDAAAVLVKMTWG